MTTQILIKNLESSKHPIQIQSPQGWVELNPGKEFETYLWDGFDMTIVEGTKHD